MMISRYAMYDIATLSNRFSLTEGLPKGIKPRYNINPSISAPVIMEDNGKRIAKQMSWGLMAKGSKNINSVFRYKTYNVPSEKILAKHSWDVAVRESRCLVPANGFYDLDATSEKRAYYTHLRDDSLLAFAGVYNSWQDAEGVWCNTFSIVTIEAPDTGHRVPVIIKREDEERWLDPTISDASSLYDMLRLHSDEGQFATHEVSSAVHSPKLNHADLINPL